MRAAALALLFAVALVARPVRAGCADSPELCGLAVQSTIEQPDLARAIDVVLVGDGFTDLASLMMQAQAAIDAFKGQNATGVYGTVPGLYNFHVVKLLSATSDVADDDTTDTAIGMRVSGPYITANEGRASLAALNAPDVDVVVMLANSGAGRANAYYPAQLASGGRVRLADLTPISHELGHALVHLADEYAESGLCSGAPSEYALLAEPNVTTSPGCEKFSHVAGAGCVEGGRYCTNGVWRSAAGCLMRASGNSGLCPVCAAELRDVLLEKRTGKDRAPPWSVAVLPPASSPVSGRFDVSTGVLDHGLGPVEVTAIVDGVWAGRATAGATYVASVSLGVDSSRLADGAHTLQLFAEDAGGHSRAGAGGVFTSSNHTPQSLTVTLVQPAPGAQLSGASFVYASTPSSEAAPALLYMELDGAPRFAVDGLRAVWDTWDTAEVPLGAHTMRAVAIDAWGSVFSSPPTDFSVVPASGGQGGGGAGVGVFIATPVSWQGVGPLFELGASAFGFSASPALTLLVDGVAVSPSPLATFGARGESSGVVVVDATAWSLGSHALTLRGTAGAQTATSSPVAVVRRADAGPMGFITSPTGGTVSGVVSVGLRGFDDIAVTRLTLLVDGAPVGSVSGASGAVSWDTTTARARCALLAVEAADADGNTGESAARTSCIDNTPPVPTVESPVAGAVLGLGVSLVVVRVTDPEDYSPTVEVLVDGVSVRARYGSGGTALTLTPGAHTITARARNAAGLVGTSASVSVTAAACESGCDDGNPCTADACAPDGCHHAPAAGCCTSPADCEDGDPCTTNSCSTGTCVSTPVAGCCTYGFQCSDGDPCTRDTCSSFGGTCGNPAGECCSSNPECDDAWACTTDTCLLGPGGACAIDRAGDCCRDAADCDDRDPCTTDGCSGGTCTHAALPGCCSGDGSCPPVGLCDIAYCDVSTFTCRTAAVSSCCESDADCAQLDPCVTSSCDTAQNKCISVRAPECCTYGFECNDYDPCTSDTCTAQLCGHSTSAVCCSVDADCDDGDVCTTGSCDRSGQCVQAAVPGCCHDAAACSDGDACTDDVCDGTNQCGHTAVPGCCNADPECDDANACTNDACVANGCAFAPIPGCCADASECNDGDPCTTDSCAASTCGHADVIGCCHDVSECDDGDACTADWCTNGTCASTPVPGCCHDASECDDGDACTVDACDANSCAHGAIADCPAPDPEPEPTVAGPGGALHGGCSCAGAGGSLPWLACLVALARRATAAGRRRRGSTSSRCPSASARDR